jgi:uncharacterized membrane protein YjdF
VPYREWLASLGLATGDGAGRNHFDRLVHFLYGFLLAFVIMLLAKVITERNRVRKWGEGRKVGPQGFEPWTKGL